MSGEESGGDVALLVRNGIVSDGAGNGLRNSWTHVCHATQCKAGVLVRVEVVGGSSM